MLRDYRRGSANISFGNNIVTGNDVSWATYCKSGDVLHVGSQSMMILDVTAQNQLTLTDTWHGISGNDVPYRIEISHDSLARNKAIKLAWVAMERSLRCVADVEALGTVWQADTVSQELVHKAMSLATAGAPLPTVWRDTYNVDLLITSINQLVAIAGAMAMATEVAYHRSWEVKAAIAVAITVEELDSIVW